VPVTKLASSVRDDLVQAIGLHVFLIIVLLGTMGWLVLRRSLGTLATHWQSWLAVGLGTVFLLGVLGLFRPGWELGDISLSEVTAGGDLGHALTSTGLGILIWLACAVGALVVRWPHASRHALARTPQAAVIAWRWRIPERIWKGLQALLQAVFPTRTAPRPKPQVPIDTLMWARTAPTTLPPDPETERPPPAEETTPPSDFGWQTELPLPGEEDSAAAEAPPQPPAAHPRESAGGWMLPPVDVLTGVAPQEGARPDNTARAQLIVDTLASFGVDVRITQINEGPTVTQFGIEPGWDVKTRLVPERDSGRRPILDRDGNPKTRTEEVSRTRVRVSQITSLSNDLALALATPSIRIEAPVPGKPVLGIEVPNNLAALVPLRGVIESAPFQRLAARSKLALALGKSVSGEPIVADLAKMPHLLIAGATGSGKSVCLNSIIACLLMHAPPAQVRRLRPDTAPGLLIHRR
jgi:S-DNA-T family DNA segregation ATPase FtsK/SpoIIIE